jgi:hypothetical protein
MSGAPDGSNIRQLRPGGGSSLPPSGRGPDDPDMETRVAALEAGLSGVRDTLTRIELAQKELAEEIRGFRRDVKETDVPAIRAQLAGLEAGLAAKPSTTDFQRISSDLRKLVWSVFGFVLALIMAVVGAAWVLRWIGLI